MTEHNDLPFINHVLDAINDIDSSMGNITKEQFIKNKDVKDANIRRIEIIGEAVKNMSNSVKDRHPEINWREIIGARDKMIHNYFGVNLDTIWEIIKKDLPKLKEQMLKIKKEIE